MLSFHLYIVFLVQTFYKMPLCVFDCSFSSKMMYKFFGTVTACKQCLYHHKNRQFLIYIRTHIDIVLHTKYETLDPILVEETQQCDRDKQSVSMTFERVRIKCMYYISRWCTFWIRILLSKRCSTLTSTLKKKRKEIRSEGDSHKQHIKHCSIELYTAVHRR